jgi:hypothetical protein
MNSKRSSQFAIFPVGLHDLVAFKRPTLDLACTPNAYAMQMLTLVY